MTTALSGRGKIYHENEHLCSVHYELSLTESEEQFALTDGLISIVEPDEGPDVLNSLRPYESLILQLETPLPDGREQLPVQIEPYQGHRPDERYQIRVIGE